MNVEILHIDECPSWEEAGARVRLALDGIDPFPSAGRISALACRVYATETGLAGSPTVAQLTEALRGRLEDLALSG